MKLLTKSSMVRKGRVAVVLAAAAAITVPLTSATVASAEPVGPAAAEAEAEVTTIAIGSATLAGGSIQIAGSVGYGADALGPVTLSEDVSGDANVSGAGFDIGDVSVEADLAASKLIFTLGINDGLAAPVDGPGPMTGYMITLMSDGDERWRWLGAGTAGSNFAAGKWGGLCHNENNSPTTGKPPGGWSCPADGALTTTITADAVVWALPFSKMKPAIQRGSVLESSSIFCGGACSFNWGPTFNLASTPVDSSFAMDEYKVPGEVELGIAPTGTQPSAVSFGTKATFTPSTSAFNAVLPAPTAPGDYTVWTRTCYGAPVSCVYGNAPIQIA